jgi:Zn-dependent metalloprotease
MNTNKKIFLATLLVVSLLVVFGFKQIVEQKPDKEKRIEAGQLFNQKYENKFIIRLNDITGTPATIRGHRITKYSGTPEQIARAFLNEEKVMLGIKNSDTDLELVNRNYLKKSGTTLQFRQKYNGVQILGSGYLVAVNNKGAIHYISGDYFPDIELDTKPSISPEAVKSIINSELAGSDIKKIEEPELFIYVKDRNTEKQSFDLIYKIIVIVSKPEDEIEYKINSVTGKIISKKSIVKRVTGSGTVYESNPTRGDTLSKTLEGLNNPVSGYYYLNGENVKVLNDEDDEASSQNAQFHYSESNTHFDEVMAYYHSDNFERWLYPLGLSESVLDTIKIYTHSDDYAAFYLVNHRIKFNDGESGRRNPTREASIITHEYMHYVTHISEKLLGESAEENAMNEAFSDYFGLAYESYMANERIDIMGEYIEVSGDQYNYTRNLYNNGWTYASFDTIEFDGWPGTDCHEQSVIFSGALWDFKWDEDVDKDIADELILASLIYTDDYTTFFEAREALIAVAENNGHSDYIDDIAWAFYYHGIGNPPPPIISITDGPHGINRNQSYEWTATISYCMWTYDYMWQKSYNSGASWNTVRQVWNTYNTVDEYSSSDTTSFCLRVIATDGVSQMDTSDVFIVAINPSVEITGPDTYYYQEDYGVWGSSVSDGMQPYSYEWIIYKDDPDDGYTIGYQDSVEIDNDLLETALKELSSEDEFTLKVIITDNLSNTSNDEKIIEYEGPAKKINTQQIPKDYALEQNYPNPFNPVTTIKFALPKASPVKLVIYDITGREVAILVNGSLPAGYHSVQWDARNVPSGMYIYRITAGSFTQAKRMMVIK